MSLSDEIDRENGDLDWREYDAEGTNAASYAALDAARYCPKCGEWKAEHDYACDGGFGDVTNGEGL